MEYYDSITGELVKTSVVVERTKVGGYKQVGFSDYTDCLLGISDFIKDDFENPTRKSVSAFKKLIERYETVIRILKRKDWTAHLDNSSLQFCFNKIPSAIDDYMSDMGMPHNEAGKEVRQQIIETIETYMKGNKHENPHYSKLIVGAIEKLVKMENSTNEKYECECGCIFANPYSLEKHRGNPSKGIKSSAKHVEMMNRMDANYKPEVKRTPDSWWLCSCNEIHKGDESKYKRHQKSVKCRSLTDARTQAHGRLPSWLNPRILSEAEAMAMLEERRKAEMECYISPSLKKSMDTYDDDEEAAEIMADAYEQSINDLKNLTFDDDDTSSIATSATPSPPPIIQKKLTGAEVRAANAQAKTERRKAGLAIEKAHNEAKNHKLKKSQTEYKQLVADKRNAPSVATPDEYEEMKCQCGCVITKNQYKYHVKEDIHAEKMKELEELAEMEAEEEYYNSMPNNNNIVLNVKEAISV